MKVHSKQNVPRTNVFKRTAMKSMSFIYYNIYYNNIVCPHTPVRCFLCASHFSFLTQNFRRHACHVCVATWTECDDMTVPSFSRLRSASLDVGQCEQRGKELDIQSVSGPHDRQDLESQEVMAFALSARAVCGDERRRRTLWRRGRVA